jgi:hypothetical protein
LANPYEGYKVNSLINTYRANPDMFNDDQLDELERLAERNEINFKRLEGNFSLRRGLQQAQAGFIEGLTTFDLIPKEPRNTGEAIFRQLGHLAGFAPAIMRAPLSIFSKYSKSGLYQALEGGIKALDDIAIPMKFSRGTKATFDKVLEKTGADTVDFLKKGAATRQITEEALGLGVASAISSVWKGTDVMADALIGGAIAGGAFGGIGNFVSVGKMYKGTPKQIEAANKKLRAGVASLFMGLPATIRRDPIEMQIYEYLLGGFFGYNTRPAYKQAVGEWLVGKKGERFGRDMRDIVDPEKAKDWDTLTNEAKNWLLYEHKTPSYKNSENLRGATGSALGWLEKNFPNTKWRQVAERHLQEVNEQITPENVQAFYRFKARDAMDLDYGRLTRAVSTSDQLYGEQQSDFMDPVTREIEYLKRTDKDVYPEVDKKQFKTENDFIAAREAAEKASLNIDGKGRQIEPYIVELRKLLGSELSAKHEARYRRKWWTETEPQKEVWYFEEGSGKSLHINLTKNSQIGTTSIGEKYDKMPLDYLGFGGFNLMTHGVNKKGKVFKILDSRMDGDGIKFTVDIKTLAKIEAGLKEKNKYIFSGLKDKDVVIIADYIDVLGRTQITKNMIIEAISGGDGVIRKAINESYKQGRESNRETFGNVENYERKWVSNVLHHGAINGLVNRNSADLSGLRTLVNKGFGKSVADFNKRLQLITNRFAPMQQASFIETNPTGKMRGMIIKDIETTGNSDTDGGMIFSHKFFGKISDTMGFDKNIGHIKPVIAGSTNFGALFTKSNGQRATSQWNKFMEKNNIDFIVFDSGAKLRGNLETTADFVYDAKTNTFNSKDPKIFEVPVEHLQVSTGTFEDPYKSIKGDELPLQFYGQASIMQSPEFAKEYFKEVVERSLAGTEKGQELAKKIETIKKERTSKREELTEKDIQEIDKLINESDFGINELPMEFVRDTLLRFPDTRLASKMINKIMKLEGEGKLDIDFEFDSNKDFRQFHANNKILAEAMIDTYAVRNTVFKNNFHNALKKFLVKRFANPYIETGGKSWLKAFTPDQLVDYKGRSLVLDPELISKNKTGLNEGDLYLDNNFKRMLIEHKYIPKKDLEAIYQGKLNELQKTNSKATMEDVNKRVTLGEAWNQYIGNKSRKDFKEWDKTFMFLVIRTPADSMSGTRQLRFRGFTNQKGSGSFTHHKDNKYLGGADKDADSIKLFQGFSKGLRDKFVAVKDERAHWKEGSEYEKAIDKVFKNENLDSTQTQRFKGYEKRIGEEGYDRAKDIEYQMYMYSPAHRLQVAQNSNAAKMGLGYGLKAKIIMQNWADFVNDKGGSYLFDFEAGKDLFSVELKLKTDDVLGQKRIQWFRDLGTAVVNKSADASTDPTIKAYPVYRKILFDSLFDANVFKVNPKTGESVRVGSNGTNSKRYFGYKEINELATDSPFSIIADAIRVTTPKSTVKRIGWTKLKDLTWNKNVTMASLPIKTAEKLNLLIGERVLTTINDVNYAITRQANKNGKAVIEKNRYDTGDAMSFFDVARVLGRTYNGIRKYNIQGVVPDIIRKMNEAGIRIENLTFPVLTRQYRNLYDNMPVEQPFQINEALMAKAKANVKKKMKRPSYQDEVQEYYRLGGEPLSSKLEFYSSKELTNFVEKHLDIITKDLSLVNPNNVGKNFDPAVSKYDFAVDAIGKSLGSFASVELLHKKFLNIHRAIDKAGIKGNVVAKLIPTLNAENTKLKKKLSSKERLDKDGIQLEVEQDIQKVARRLTDMAVKLDIDPTPFLSYWHTLLLSPITQLPSSYYYNKSTFYKDIHSSLAIPFSSKKEFYGKMEELFNRGQDPSTVELKAKAETIPELKELAMQVTEAELLSQLPAKRKRKIKTDPNQFDLFNPPKVELEATKNVEVPAVETLTEVVQSKAVDRMAINDYQYKEVKKFRKHMDRHRLIKNNFEQWFEYFTGILSGGGKYREVSTIRMDDIIAINRYFEGIQDPYRLAFKLRYWYMDPRFVDEKLATKNIINKYYQYYAPVQTATGRKDKPIFFFTSPIGEIAKYNSATERFVSRDVKFLEDRIYQPIEKELMKYGRDERFKLVEELFDYREKGIIPQDAKRLQQIEALNKPVTEFFKRMQDVIYTKDSKGNKASDASGTWVMEKDFLQWYADTGGVLNKYMRWKKDGRMDLEHFRKTVIENDNINNPEVIKTVGIEGIKRYQLEHKLEQVIRRDPKRNSLVYRNEAHAKMKGIGERDINKYMPHMNFKNTKQSKKEVAAFIEKEANRIYAEVYGRSIAKGFTPEESAKKADRAFREYTRNQENNLIGAEEFFAYREVVEPSKITEADLNVQLSEQGSLTGLLKARTANMPGYEKSPEIFSEYLNKVVESYYKNATAIKGQYEIDNMVYRLTEAKNTKYDVSKKEKALLKDSEYNSPVEVWADYVKLYLQSILGHQSYFSTRMTADKSPLQLKSNKNLFYLTSDENVIRIYEKYYQNKNVKLPFFKHAPKSAEARKEYFSRHLHSLGRMEAQYQLMSLLANTGTWTTNIFSGSAMTIGSAGIKNFADSYSNKKIYDMLLTDGKGKEVIKLNNGEFAKNRKDLLRHLEENGVIDAFIQNEFEVNTRLRSGLEKAGVNVKTFTREITSAAKSKNPDLTVLEVIKKYGVMDTMVKYGSFFMQNSERINRLNAFTAHAMQAVKKFGVDGKDLSIADPFVFDMAMKGIENTQFLYQNSARPAFMRTAVGKVLSRFKLFVWNSVRVRKEFYRQSKLYGFKEGTPEYNRFKDTYMIDMFMFALANAFMFSIFDTALAPPLDTFQSIADSLYGDKRERDMAFWGSKLGALQLLKPPVARIPDAAIELLTGDWEKFSSYTAYTMFPFGRGVRQLVQLSERPERAGEILLRLPVNQVKSRIERAKRRGMQMEDIEETLGE